MKRELIDEHIHLGNLYKGHTCYDECGAETRYEIWKEDDLYVLYITEDGETQEVCLGKETPNMHEIITDGY